MPRGGSRKGTPGKGYTNRTDMTSNYNMADGSPADGGLQAPKSSSPMVLPVYPDQTPNLMDPTNRPDEPVTAGLRSGAGPGMESMTGFDPRVAETQALKRWLPLLEPIIARPDAPDSVKILVRYIKGS